jgi:hypothetical protein
MVLSSCRGWPGTESENRRVAAANRADGKRSHRSAAGIARPMAGFLRAGALASPPASQTGGALSGGEPGEENGDRPNGGRRCRIAQRRFRSVPIPVAIVA